MGRTSEKTRHYNDNCHVRDYLFFVSPSEHTHRILPGCFYGGGFWTVGAAAEGSSV